MNIIQLFIWTDLIHPKPKAQVLHPLVFLIVCISPSPSLIIKLYLPFYGPE